MPPAIPRGLQPGDQIDYVELTTDTVISATTKGSANTVITGNARSYDGATRVLIEFWTPFAYNPNPQHIIATLWEDSTDLGRIGQVGASIGACLHGMRFLTPAAGVHTYTIKSWVTGSTGTIYAATASENLPAWYRITKA